MTTGITGGSALPKFALKKLIHLIGILPDSRFMTMAIHESMLMKRWGILAFATALTGLSVPGHSADTGPEGPPAEKAPATPAAEVLTLDKCLTRALANSAEISAERHRLDALDEQEKQLMWLPFSDFAVKGMFTVVPDKCADTTGGTLTPCGGEGNIPSDNAYKDMSWGPSFHIGLEATLPIPVSNRFSSALRAIREGKSAKAAMLPTLEDEIRYNVHRAFHAIIGAREMLYTLSEGQKHLASARRLLEENLEKQQGTETEIDLIKLKVFEAQLEVMAQQSRQLEKTAMAAMAFLIGQPAGKPFDLPEDPQAQLAIEVKTLDDYKRPAVANRPELEALRHAVNAMDAKLDLARSEFAPELAFVVNFKAGYTPGVETVEQKTRNDGTTYTDDATVPFLYKNSYNYGSLFPGMALVMRYPLDFGMDVHRVRQARAELSALIIEKKQALQAILLEVETTYTEVASLGTTIDTLSQARRLTKGWMAAALQNHAAGVGSSKEVKDALKEYFATMAQLHQAIGEYNIGLAKLDRVTGVRAEKK